MVVAGYTRMKVLEKMVMRWVMKDPNTLYDVDVTTWLDTLVDELVT